MQAEAEFSPANLCQGIVGVLVHGEFYNCILPNTAPLLQPIYGALQLNKASDPVDWTPEHVQAFDKAKYALASS